MEEASFISDAGELVIDGRTYRMPERFSSSDVSILRSLIAPVPDIRGGTALTVEQRSVTEDYLLRRAAAFAIPGCTMSVAASLSHAQLQSIRRWIARRHPTLTTGSR